MVCANFSMRLRCMGSSLLALDPSCLTTEEEILVFCKERLASYKTPKSVEFREDLPKSAVGKLLRRVLVDEELARSGAMPQGG